MSFRRRLLPLLAFLSISLCNGGEYAFDTGRSAIDIRVPKAGLLSFVGHEHFIRTESVSGTLHRDFENAAKTKVSFSVSVMSLEVLDPSLSEDDRATVTEHMQAPDVLNKATHESITFTSSSVEELSETLWELSGFLVVGGQEAKISFEATVEELPDGGLSVIGETTLKLADFRIKPVSALAGAVKTGKSVDITFSVVTLPPQISNSL